MRVRERRHAEREARARRIQAAARRVFADHGVNGATMEMIARQAKVAVGTIYLHFSSRDEVYLSLSIESAERLRTRYLEVKSRGLDPLEELRALATAYIDHLRGWCDPFLSSQSVNHAQLRKRLHCAVEIRKFDRLVNLCSELFTLFEGTVRRACDAGLIANPLGPTKATALVWAILNGVFVLTCDSEFLRDVTGLDPEHFVEQMFESHLMTVRIGKEGAKPQAETLAGGKPVCGWERRCD